MADLPSYPGHPDDWTDEQWETYTAARRRQQEAVERRNARVTLSNDRLRAKKMLKEWRRNGSLKNPDLTVDDILKEGVDEKIPTPSPEDRTQLIQILMSEGNVAELADKIQQHGFSRSVLTEEQVNRVLFRYDTIDAYTVRDATKDLNAALADVRAKA